MRIFLCLQSSEDLQSTQPLFFALPLHLLLHKRKKYLRPIPCRCIYLQQLHRPVKMLLFPKTCKNLQTLKGACLISRCPRSWLAQIFQSPVSSTICPTLLQLDLSPLYPPDLQSLTSNLTFPCLSSHLHPPLLPRLQTPPPPMQRL